MEIYLCFSEVSDPVNWYIFSTCPSTKVSAFDPQNMQESVRVIDSLHSRRPDCDHPHIAGYWLGFTIIAAPH